MKKTNNRTRRQPIRLLLALSMTVLFASVGVTSLPQNSFAQSSQPSATPVDDLAGLRRACAEAVEELRAARKVIEAQDKEIKVLRELNALERQLSDGLKNIRTLDAAELQALRNAIEAKDRVIAAYEAEIVVLKKNKWSTWKWIKAAAVGAAAGIIAGSVLINE